MPELTRPRKFQAKASEYPTIKGLGARLTGGSSQEPAARWRLEFRPLAFVVVTFKQVLGKAVLFSCEVSEQKIRERAHHLWEQRSNHMTPHIPEEFSTRLIDWCPFVIMGNMMPPRDPEEDEGDEEEEERADEPPVVREPDED